MGRVFVMALDGLEYDLVIKWRLKNLLQKKYGKIQVKPSYYFPNGHDVPWTAKVWSSFVTGTPPEKLGIRSFSTYGKILDFIRFLPPFKWIKNKRRFLVKIGICPRTPTRKDMSYRTLADVVNPSVSVYFPFVDDIFNLRRFMLLFETHGAKVFEKEMLKVHRLRIDLTFKMLEEKHDWKLFLTYFDAPDLMGHLHIAKRLKRLKRFYQSLDFLAYKLKKKVPEDTVFLIVSDHGMQPMPDGTGDHSCHAFWSVNIDTDWEPKDIIDFYPQILRWCK